MPDGAETTEQKLARLQELREEALHQATEKAVARQREHGKLLARERLEILLDHGSFVEMDRLRTHQCTDFDMDKKKIGRASCRERV